uniref:Secreted protein n=2 Tax=Caenorhabditis tropicalis TaxID=1561998 RepID=A0A1I7U0D4_9PELO
MVVFLFLISPGAMDRPIFPITSLSLFPCLSIHSLTLLFVENETERFGVCNYRGGFYTSRVAPRVSRMRQSDNALQAIRMG